ncbi:MAG: ABC transporter permease [Dehalococcoidia bacterium]|nr:ABC transporter permease [Dehalococcoidia bacterium]MSQ16122.1 ABC transporter permease [Dehalococcoidia bacterium]
MRTKTRRLKLPWIPVAIVSTLVICAIFAEVLTSVDPREINMLEARMSPAVISEFFGGADANYSWSHPLGTDVMGRDMLSRLIYGARTSVLISLVALSFGMVVGTTLGLIAGYRGKWVDALVMRFADAALGFPTILVAMIIVVLLGAGMLNIVLAVMLTVWARFARMIRGDVLAIRELDFVTQAKIAGVSAHMIIARHIFPNIVNTLLVITSLQIGQVILLEASLSFLGLGLPPGEAAWGIMVAEGRTVIVDVWWLSLLPGLAITIVVLAFNFFGDWMRDTMDPKLRRA